MPNRNRAKLRREQERRHREATQQTARQKANIKRTTYVLINMNPYESDELENVIGPFATQKGAQSAKEKIFKNGGHEDSGYEIMKLTSLKSELERIKFTYGEEDEPWLSKGKVVK